MTKHIGIVACSYEGAAFFIISPDNTIHQSFSHIEKDSPLPWLHISEEVTKVAADRWDKSPFCAIPPYP